MDLDLSPSWPPPGAWRLGVAVGSFIAAAIPAVALPLAGLDSVNPLLVGMIVALVLACSQAYSRWMSSRRPRILRLSDEELSSVMKLIDQAAQAGDRALLTQAKEHLTLHRRISRRDASTAVGKLLRKDYPQLADRFGYLD